MRLSSSISMPSTLPRWRRLSMSFWTHMSSRLRGFLPDSILPRCKQQPKHNSLRQTAKLAAPRHAPERNNSINRPCAAGDEGETNSYFNRRNQGRGRAYGSD
jgi:hypothetical protein